MKNPHAVELGKLGGSKGGKARAEALSPRERRDIAINAGHLRAASLSPARRSAIARRAAIARWSKDLTGMDTPAPVRSLLKTYNPADLRWINPDDRYAIVCEILIRGNSEARQWLDQMLDLDQVRQLVKEYRGTGCTEPDRVRLRTEFNLSADDIPVRPWPHLGMGW